MTRQSKLALIQANAVSVALQKLNPDTKVELIKMDAEADKILDHTLAKFGGKGLFTNRLEKALLEHQADLAVHCVKDMPTENTSGLIITAMPKRADVRDTLISPHESIQSLPQGATFGTASPRRAAQVLKIRPDLQVELLRGNVQTRYDAVMIEKRFDATLLAMAGLERLSFPELPQLREKAIPTELLLPAPGQGALALQCRADDHVTMRRCFPINDSASSTLVNTEREIVRRLNGDCHSPIAAYASFNEVNQIVVEIQIFSPDGSSMISTTDTDTIRNIGKLCDRATQSLLDQGAAKLLAEAAEQSTNN